MEGPSQVLGYLFLGGKKDAADKQLMARLKISHILNCTPPRAMDPEAGVPNFFEKERAFVYHRIPVFDNRGEDLLQHMEESYRFIEGGKHHGGVLVHCHKGVSRSASFVIAYLMRKNEMSLDEALEYTKSVRAVIQPNEAFMSQLKAYEAQLQREREADGHAPPSSSSGGGGGGGGGGSASRQNASAGPAVGPAVGPAAGPAVGPAAGPAVGPEVGPSFPSADGASTESSGCPRADGVDGARSAIGPVGPPTETADDQGGDGEGEESQRKRRRVDGDAADQAAGAP